MLREIKLLLMMLILSVSTFAQTRVYRGNSIMQSDVICTIRENRIYAENSNMQSDIVCSIRDGKVYDGNSIMESQVLISFEGDVAYRMRSRMNSSILYSQVENRIRFHNGYSFQTIATVRENKVYRGVSNMESDVLFRFDSEYTYQQLIAILHLINE